MTEFFRDPLAFAALRGRAFPVLLADKGASDVLRVWVPGCATGEEAYSIAISLREAMGAQHGPRVQIFATDIDDRAIEAVRAGRYRAPLLGVSPERQQRWFAKDGDGYCVIEQVREMCVFSPHSVIKDPPFSRLDLVSCRNVLIYMNPELQERLFRAFHYALRPGAFLLLGPSENLSRGARLFKEVDKKQRLYVRRDNGHLAGASPFLLAGRAPAHGAAAASRIDDGIERTVRRVMAKYTPAYVVIDAQHNVLRLSGDTGRYLSPSAGAAGLNVFELLRKRLREPARAVVRQALAGAGKAVRDGLAVEINGHHQPLRLIAEPLTSEDEKSLLCALVFDEPELAPTVNPAARQDPSVGDLVRIHTLEHELEASRTQLHAAVELHESVNEELQSINEELETSKGETQSINEELNVVNAEINSKNEALNRLSNDLRNLMERTQLATLFLTPDLRIGNYTPATTDLFHLHVGDRGRPITEISARINYPELRHDVADVLRHPHVVERVLRGSTDEPAYLLRMRPYRTLENVIDGVVLTFVDVTESLRHEVERGQLAAIVESSRDAIIGYTLNDTISSWNASAEHLFDHSAAQACGQPLSLLLPADAGEADRAWLAGSHRGSAGEFETQWRTRDGYAVPVAVTDSPVRDAAGKLIAGSLIVRDIADRHRAEQHTRMMLGELDHRVKNTLASVQALALQTFANAPDLAQFQDSFLGRLHALSATHNLLAVDAWRDIELRAIVLGELTPYRDEQRPARLQLCGDDVCLPSKMALALGMALHELTTNAVRYGALSVPQGNVQVSWETRRVERSPWLHVSWCENEGPAVRAPTRRGFGTRLIASGLPFELDGRVTLDFPPTGVRCIIDLPLHGPADTP